MVLDRQLRRILVVEKLLILPVKIGFLLITLLFFSAPEQVFGVFTKPFFFYQTILYVVANIIFYSVVQWAQIHQWSAGSIKVSVFFISVIDSLYLTFLIPLTGGLDSPIYWIYSGLMVRNAVNFPNVRQQGLLNLAFCLFYGAVVYFSEKEPELFLSEVFYLKMIVLVLISLCGYGIYALFQERAILAADEREKNLRNQRIFAMERLAGEIAHGLKNPLSIINNASYFLEKKITEDDVRNHVRVIREEVARSDKILSQIMNYSKLSAVKVEKVNINQAINSVIDELRLETAFPGVKVERILYKGLPSIFLDRGHLRQVLSNLIINSAEAINEKSDHKGVIRIKTDSVADESIRVMISDDGVGMDDETRKKVFEPFYTTKDKGTGLGLSIVKNIVETYDGVIKVDSEPGKGTSFEILWGGKTEG